MNPTTTNPFAGSRILLVDDSPANLAVLTAAFESEPCELLAASNGTDALRVATRAGPDLVLLDVVLPDIDGFETCRRLRAHDATRDIPVIFLTARAEADAVIDGFRAGGVDYIAKPFRAEEVLTRAATHLRLHHLARELATRNQALETRTAELLAEIDRRREAEEARRQSDERLAAFADLEASRWGSTGIIGSSPQVRAIAEDLRRLRAFPNTSVLVTGESGTGKELIARALHLGSSRAAAPFVPVNCAAIPAELAESTFFGHVRGAFTGAQSDRKGCFELAHQGTLFLDEVGDMPLPLQAKILRVLEDGLVTPVGSTAPRRVDVRIVAATNADLPARIASGAFRQDLYFRLARYVLAAAPLRERREDIPALARHFLERFASEMGVRDATFSPRALAALAAHDFPGNVRELRNVVERALIHSGGNPVEPADLRLPPPRTPVPEPCHSVATPPAPDRIPAATPRPDPVADLPLNLAEAEERLIQRALQVSQGNVVEAARLLGIHRSRIYRRLAPDGTSTPPPSPEPT